MKVYINNETDEVSASIPANLPELAEFAYAQVVTSSGDTVELSITLVDAEDIQALNRDYRDLDAATDVLSFPMSDGDDEGDSDNDSDEPVLLGDIIIAPSQTEDLELMVVHGLLHLLGYDHVVDDDAEVMEKLTDDILGAWHERSAA